MYFPALPGGAFQKAPEGTPPQYWPHRRFRGGDADKGA